MTKLILDGTFYINDPLKNIGLQSISIYYAGKIFTTTDGQKLPKSIGLPPKDRVIQLAKGSGDRLQFDIEGNDWASNLQYYETVSDWVKAAVPNKNFGWYRIVPKREFWKSLEDQKATNDKRQGIADRVQSFYPSFYNLFDDPALATWKHMATTNAQEARRMARNGQKVYPYLWPQYHPGSSKTSIRRQFIPYAMFKEMMLHTLSVADGFVLWGGYSWNSGGDDSGPSGPITWASREKDSGWYRALTEVMSDLGSIPDIPTEPEPDEPEPPVPADPDLTARVEALESSVSVLGAAVSAINTRLDVVNLELQNSKAARREAGEALKGAGTALLP